MTDNPFATLRTNIVRAIFDPGTTVGYKGDRSVTQWQTDAVLAALAAAVPADLAEAGKVLDEIRRVDPFENPLAASEAEQRAADTIRSLIATVTAQEAQIKGLTKERDELRDMLERSQHVVPDLYTKWHEKAASLLKRSDHE